MNSGKEFRMGRLFNKQTKRMVLITADHGICVSPMHELNDMRGLVGKLVAGGADAVLVTPGIGRKVYQEIAGSETAFMLRIDGTATSIGPDLTNDEQICSVEAALKMGVDAVATFGVIGVAREAQLSKKIAFIAEDCERWGVPMMCEMLPESILEYQFSPRAKREWPKDVEALKYCARVPVELGADIIKGFYTGDPKTFREIIDYCPAPYVVLAGPAANDVEVFLGFVREAVQNGAAGVSCGRNVWSNPDPTRVVRALMRVVHEEATVAQALKS
jgi:fructose-bisphosphate aldolase/2-amino-3,7-dideoxy-D-threo-hept-6-ulosonate synthase